MAQLPETYCGTQIGKFGLDGLVYRTDLKMSDLKQKLGEEQIIVRVISSAINDFVSTDIDGKTPISVEGNFPGYSAAGEIVFAGSKIDQSVIGKYVQALTFQLQGGCSEYAISDYKDCIVFEREEWNEETMQVPDFANTMTGYGIYEKILKFGGKNVISMMGGSNISRYVNRLLAQHEGYRVLNVIRNPSKIDQLKKDLNTEHVVDMENLEEKIKEFCGETPNPIILDPLGGQLCEKIFHSANYGATLIVYETITGQTINLNLNHVLWTEKTITYFNQIGYFTRKNHEEREELKQNIKKNISTVFNTKCHKKFTQDKLADAVKELHHGIEGGSRILIVPVQKENPEN